VNNARYFTWFESCRTAYFMRIGLKVGGPSSLGPIMAHISCDYLSPIVYPATLVCGARVPKIGNTSFSMQYALWRRDDAAKSPTTLGSPRRGTGDAPADLCARGESVIVLMDYATMQKVRVTDDLRRAIANVET
jgi:acyl-CoA thioester hydrolase